MSQVRIGTSGWTYDDWKGVFYPPGLSPRRWLEHYAQEFDTVEVNATFYRLLPESTFAGWDSRVPEGFLFALKASRPITHLKKLADAEEELSRFLARAELLSHRLGPLLFQLPPQWPVDAARLEAFLSLLPTRFRCAFEFRDPSWLTEPVYAALRKRGAALVRVSAPHFPDADVVTADFSYLRMHGDQRTHASKYSAPTLTLWARAIAGWAAAGRDVFVYFNNDLHGYAVEDARALRRLVAQQC
jgi:uncharacterized protein YecE (DUF72 family)